MEEGISRMEGQVAGHMWEEDKVGFLAMPGRVLKPICGERGKREREFYETEKPSRFLASYFGVRTVGGVDHLVLQDVREGMKHPCVMDLKTGRKCYTPDQGETKALFFSFAKEKKKVLKRKRLR